MKVIFTTKNGKNFIGTVIGEGLFIVDGPKSYQIRVEKLPHVDFVIPVINCRAV